LPNPGAGSAGDGGGKDDGRDGHAGGRCGIGSAEPVPGAQLAGVEGLPAGARGVYMPRSQQSLRKPSRGRWTSNGGPPRGDTIPRQPGGAPRRQSRACGPRTSLGSPARSPSHHGRDISPIPTRSTPSQCAGKGEE
jgi:hypothetical protein